jgi:hypothetical protein
MKPQTPITTEEWFKKITKGEPPYMVAVKNYVEPKEGDVFMLEGQAIMLLKQILMEDLIAKYGYHETYQDCLAFEVSID